MSFTSDILNYVQAQYPVISLATFEERHTDVFLAKWKKSIGAKKIREWNFAKGWVDFKTKRNLMDEPMPLEAALSLLLAEDELQGFLVLRDYHLALRNSPAAVTRLKSLIRKMQSDPDSEMTIFLIAHEHEIPRELEKDVVRFDVPMPDRNEIEELLKSHAKTFDYQLHKEQLPNIITSLLGLGEQELEQLLNRAYTVNGNISEGDVGLFLSEKDQIIRRNGRLEMVKSSERLEDIGGLKYLKSWLSRKGRIFSNLSAAHDFSVDTPKGVLIVGMPGCGKSLAAKATANIFKTPLLRLDMGAMLGKYVGESEANMRRALKMAESISPCVLWVDELEKAFTGVGGNQAHEVTSRMFGYFLTWLQEKKTPVFVVATANNVTLPPELLRRGRFDETFFVTFPSQEEREQILRIHLAKRKKTLSESDIRALASRMKDFAGSDIEAAVKDAVENAFLEGKSELTRIHVEKASSEIKPLKIMLPDHIKKYEDMFKSYKIRPAS